MKEDKSNKFIIGVNKSDSKPEKIVLEAARKISELTDALIKKQVERKNRIMSYDIYLRDPVTREVAEVPGHLMIGGTYKAEYHPETGTFTPALNKEAHLNITYNYGKYYREASEENGIRCIYGLSGQESISVLQKMISFLEEKYKKNDDWITTQREKRIFYDKDGKEIDDPFISILKGEKYRTEEIIVDRYEGSDENYWNPTAANAIKPLWQLIALARMRPDCIWDGD